MKIIEKLITLRDKAESLRINLTKLIDKEQQHAQKEKINEEIELIEKALENSKVPESFRIAVVGTFKTGKSSFVNKLAGERLAGVETNPETAAISIFRYADKPRAEVKLISSNEWAKMEELYDENPNHPEAYRVAGLKTFNDDIAKQQKKSTHSIKLEKIDPETMIKTWIKKESYVHVIQADKWDTKQGKQLFRKEIRKFTSSRNPLHYFVKELSIYTPVSLFRDHVELIDTPGLNDTQLYRGQLTEDLLAEVDAILFLTRSGASFSQYDKEFIVRQLRKKRLRHLRLVVTQVDTTYEAAKHDAIEDDEDPPSFSEVQAKEEERLRSEISKTLDELLDDSDKDEDGYYYMEQLDDLKIHFTSSRWFDDGKIDESGIPAIKEALFEVLSENYHLNHLADNLDLTIDAIRNRLRNLFKERRSIIEAEFDPQKVTNNMEEIEKKLLIHLDSFENKIKELIEAHEADQESLHELMDANISRMQLMARAVLSEAEKSDISRHWKSRRHGYWGSYLSILGEKVADKVFPVMEISLKRKINPFAEFLDLASNSLDGLQNEILKLENESAIQGLPKIEFSEAKERFMKSYIDGMKEQVNNEKDAIVEILEEFATGELREKLTDAKDDVSDVWGRGTTIRQNEVVSSFYEDIGNILLKALGQYLSKRIEAFSSSLSKSTNSLYPKLRLSVQSVLDNRKHLIQEHLRIQTDEARKQLEKYLESGLNILDGKIQLLDNSDVNIKEKPEEIEIDIKEGETGYSYEMIFGSYIENATEIFIKEPYLRIQYQLENFNHFCSLAARCPKIKVIKLVTGSLNMTNKDFSDSYLEDIHKRLLENYSIQFTWNRDSKLHTREIQTDDGWLIISDRGLDIYKKVENRNEFGHFDLSLRKCKQTKVHIRKKL